MLQKPEKYRTDLGLHRRCIPGIRRRFGFSPTPTAICEIFFIFFMQHWGLQASIQLSAIKSGTS